MILRLDIAVTRRNAYLVAGVSVPLDTLHCYALPVRALDSVSYFPEAALTQSSAE